MGHLVSCPLCGSMEALFPMPVPDEQDMPYSEVIDDDDD